MCEPATLSLLAMATTAASIATQAVSARNQEKAIEAQTEAAEKETRGAATAELNERQRAARREQSRIKVAAGQAGLNLGGSVDTLLQDSMMQAGLAGEATRDNMHNRVASQQAEASAAYSRIDKPNVLTAGLQMANAGMSGYSQGLQIQKASKTPITKQK